MEVAVQRRMRLTAELMVLVAMTSWGVSCRSSPSPTTPVAPTPAAAVPPAAAASPPLDESVELRADTPRVTARGTSFVAPQGWKLRTRGAAQFLELAKEGSWMAVVDVEATTPDAAIEEAWRACGASPRRVKTSSERLNREGWRRTRKYVYETAPRERREVQAIARLSPAGRWTVVIEDASVGPIAGLARQRKLIHQTLLPSGYERESFAGKKPRPLDSAAITALHTFVTAGQAELGIPGVSLGIVEDGKVVFAGGFGVRELGKPTPVDADTLYMIASQTKPLTTLMLAKLVEEGKLSWETPVTTLYPSLKLGSPEATAALRLKHLVCACTGTPRKDWSVLEFRASTPQTKLEELARFTPTKKLGEVFQYSDLLVAAAGFMGAHVAYPRLELGAAYDKALATRVFEPLGMKATTLDHRAALRRANRAMPHSPDRDGKPAPALEVLNELLPAQRPAGGVWSNVTDMLKYVQLELRRGALPDGRRYIQEEALLARRSPQVSVDEAASYALGLFVETRKGVDLVYHGGDVIGYHSEMVWLPQFGVGSVILTNGDPGWSLSRAFRRKLLEVLFDGRPEADASLPSLSKSFYEDLAEKRRLVTLPANEADAAQLARRYASDELGDLTVRRDGSALIFDFGEWKSEVASRRNADGSASFRAVDAGAWVFDLELTTGGEGAKRTLTVRDEPYDYTFTEVVPADEPRQP